MWSTTLWTKDHKVAFLFGTQDEARGALYYIVDTTKYTLSDVRVEQEKSVPQDCKSIYIQG